MSEMDQSQSSSELSGKARYLVGSIVMIVVALAVGFIGMSITLSIHTIDWLDYVVPPIAMFLGMAASSKVSKSILPGILGSAIITVGFAVTFLVIEGSLDGAGKLLTFMAVCGVGSAVVLLVMGGGSSFGKYSSALGANGTKAGLDASSPEFALPKITKVRGTVLSINTVDSSYTNVYTEPESGHTNIVGTSYYIKRDKIKTERVRNEKVTMEVQDEEGNIKVHKFVNHDFDLLPGHKVEFVLFDGHLERIRNLTTKTWTDGFGEFLITDGRFEPSNGMGQIIMGSLCLSIPVINVMSIFSILGAYNPNDRSRPYLGNSLAIATWMYVLYSIATTLTLTPFINTYLLGAIGLEALAIHMSLGEFGAYLAISTVMWSIIYSKVLGGIHRRLVFMTELCEKAI